MIKSTTKPSALQSYVRGHKRALAEGFLMPWKQPLKSSMTVLTLAICFYIPLFLWTLWLNYDELKQSWQNQGSIAVFVHDSLDMKETGILLQQIKDEDVVNEATLMTANEIKQQLNNDEQLSQFIDLISTQDLPKQINVKVHESTSSEAIERFVNQYEINPQIEYVSYDKQWLNQLQALTQTLLQMARISALMFVLIIMVILGNTIANEITDHKNELRLLELIGATWAQVRRSFLYMGTFLGIYAGLLALLFLAVSFWWFDDLATSLAQNFGMNLNFHGLSFSQIFLVLAVSIIVTWLAARMTLTSQRLNQIRD